MAILLIVVIIGVVLDFKLSGQVVVVGVDSAGSGGEGRVTVLLCPLVEDAGEKGWMTKLDFLVIRFNHDLFVEIILDCVA